MGSKNLRRVPVYSPALTRKDAEAVADTVLEGAIAAGAVGRPSPVERFEQAWAERTRMPQAVAIANGTAALELAVDALGIGPGDEVVCPAWTIISCVRAIVFAGATPVLADVDEETWCIDVPEIERRIGPRTRAVLAVHAFGTPYDHEGIGRVAPGVRVIEDAAQAHGARVAQSTGHVPCGGLGDVSVFSFYANKPVTTGEGGMVLARDDRVAKRVRDAANLFLGGPRRFLHAELGHNYRMSSLAAALGLSQLERLDETVAVKRRIAGLYRARLSRLDEVVLQKTRPGDEPIHWMNALVLADSVHADAATIIEALSRRGVEARPFFVGFHEQPALLARGLFHGERHPVTERLSRRGLYLPSGLDLDEETIDYVVRALEEALMEAAESKVFVPDARVPSGAPEIASDDRAPFGTAFAEAYDALYRAKDYAAEASFLERCFERFASAPVRRVLDIGCGTGRHAHELANRGFEVVGVDRSPAMLEIARQRAPSLRFIEGDMRDVDLRERFDAVVMLFAALSYQTTPDAILAALRTARRHLPAGGLLVADVWFGTPSISGRALQTFRSGSNGDVVWSRRGTLARDPLHQRVSVTYTLERQEANQAVSTEETHVMHYFSQFELDFALRNAGFRLLSLTAEGTLDKVPASSDLTAVFAARAS